MDCWNQLSIQGRKGRYIREESQIGCQGLTVNLKNNDVEEGTRSTTDHPVSATDLSGADHGSIHHEGLNPADQTAPVETVVPAHGSESSSFAFCYAASMIG